MNSLNRYTHYLSELSPSEAFQLGDFQSEGWCHARLAHELLCNLKNEYKLETVFSIIENSMKASAIDPIWQEFLLAALEDLQKHEQKEQ